MSSATEVRKIKRCCKAIESWYIVNKSKPYPWFKYFFAEGYCDQDGLETEFNGTKMVASEFEDFRQCDLIIVDPSFPLPFSEHSIIKRHIKIFYVLKYCYINSYPPKIQSIKMKSLKLSTMDQYMHMDIIAENAVISACEPQPFKVSISNTSVLSATAPVFSMSVERKNDSYDTYSQSMLPSTETEDRKCSENGTKSMHTKKSKKKSRPARRFTEGCEKYNPKSKFRGQGIINFSKKLTNEEIPNQIQEICIAVYKYLDKSVALQNYDSLVLEYDIGHKRLRLFNIDLKNKNNKELYLLVESQDKRCKSNRNYGWRAVGLWTKDEIVKVFSNVIHLPRSSRELSSFKCQLNAHKLSVGQLMKIFQKTPWHKIPVLHKIEHKSRLTLAMTKSQFIDRSCTVLKSLNLNDCVDLVRILLFNEKTYYLQHLFILSLDENGLNITIGIGLQYISQKNAFIVTCIHLDKATIEEHHKLVMPSHAQECKCLDNFSRNIHALHIGNADDELNKKKHYKKRYEEWQEFGKMIVEQYSRSNSTLALKVQKMLSS